MSIFGVIRLVLNLAFSNSGAIQIEVKLRYGRPSKMCVV